MLNFFNTKSKIYKNEKQLPEESLRYILPASSLGLVFGISIAIGCAMGYFFDKWFGTAPYGLLFFLFIGIASGFRNMYIFYKRAMRSISSTENNITNK